MKKTKIICTMGPATADDEVLKEIMRSGMDVARINFSHGNGAEHLPKVEQIKRLREELGLPIALLLDTSGPEIRLGNFENDKIQLNAGDIFTLTARNIIGNEKEASITYKNLVKDVKPGMRILIDDGLIEMRVKEVTDTDIVCEVENGGTVSNHKGINVPDAHLTMPYISEKDRNDLIFGVEQGFDFVAASFVRCADDIVQLRNLLREHGDNDMKILAKIENREGVDNIDEILAVSDGVMVARGDMGVEIPIQEVPAIQKLIIKKVYNAGKIVITATQMLDSMIRNPRPTRAEVADVANAIYDGTDAIMLSGETAAGKYPVDALQMMAEIAEMTEPHLDYKVFIEHRSMDGREKISSAVALATVRTAKNLKANAIVTPTMSGNTARLISNFRPKVPIYAITPNSTIQHKLQLIWGVTPLKGYQRDTTDHIMSQAMNVVRSRHLIHKGDLVVFTAGDPATNMTNGHGAVTNMMHVIEAE